MFDGMRYVPVLLRGEVALLKEVPEDDVARTSRARETAAAPDASAISEEESESDDEGESVHVSQDGLGPAETEAERRERLRAEFFAEIAAAASRRALRRLLYKSTRDRHSISKSKQLGLCTVGPGGIVLELAMLNAAYESPSNPMTDWSDATFFGQKRGSAWIPNLRPDFNASRREPARHNGTAVSKRVALFMGAEANRAKAEEKVPAVLKKAQDDLAEKQKAEARRAMAYRSAHLAHRLKQRASGRDTSRRASAAKPPPLVLGAPASDDDDDSDVPSGDDEDLFDAEETTDRLVTMLPFRHPGDQTHQFRPNVKGAPSAHQVALKLSIAPKDQLQCYPELVDDLPTPFAVPFAYDSMPDTRLHPHSVIVRKKRVRARRAFVRADWNIREEDHAEAVLMDEAQGTAAAHQRQRRTDVNQTFYDRRATNALVKRKTSSMASHGITNHRMTQKRESTLH
ncbi:zinc-binding domain-containing protein [Aureococcus anophagefferens]|nr:zinc-binding domain-containing protein [Aureococcus anophagefferens]